MIYPHGVDCSSQKYFNFGWTREQWGNAYGDRERETCESSCVCVFALVCVSVCGSACEQECERQGVCIFLGCLSLSLSSWVLSPRVCGGRDGW